MIDEADALYRCYFAEMIKDWRQKWYEGTNKQTKIDFPFGFVQVSRRLSFPSLYALLLVSSRRN